MTELEVQVPVETMVLSGEGENAQWHPLPSALGFSSEDPLAAILLIGVAGGVTPVEWVFAFDLIHRASRGWPKVGVGDVRFGADDLDPSWVILRLSSSDASATLRLRVLDVKKYVEAVKAMLGAQPAVDIVAESLDKTISAILEGSA